MAQAVPVTTPEGSYTLHIARGALADPARIEMFLGEARRVIVTNTTVAPIYGQALADRLNAPLITIPDGEAHKTLDTVATLYREFVNAGLDRGGAVIALGGGVVGDTVGFAAATYLRGVSLIQIPTSLLSMIDSSVGGKVGVDLPEGKNLVGAFKQPALVIIDPDALRTLPPREIRCGLAEMIKHGLLADPPLLTAIERTQGLDDDAQIDALADLIAPAVRVKVAVVEADPYEQNIRAYLNLGHTFAHAIERVTRYAVPHGEAVAIGLVAAARLGERVGVSGTGLAQQVECLVRACGLPTAIGALDAEALYDAMGTDKKWARGGNRFVLLGGVGQPTIVADVPPGDVIAVLESMHEENPS